ncbi:ATP phosphoribosyltransferase [Candidatus Daviesbacteria bacterium]|nr:ATP phosphoribosyltransferase [Candidatus Daviesbacteria bacterium]
MNERLTIAIQKSEGRLAADSKSLLLDADFRFRPKPRVDYIDTEDFPLRIRLLRNELIARDVQDGFADFAFLGLDMVEESEKNVLRLLRLGFAKCELYLGVRKESSYRQITDLAGQKVVTSYLAIARSYFQDKATEVNLEYREGGEETFVNEGNAEGCIVISDSGESRDANGIRVLDTLLKSEAYLIASISLRENRGSERIVEQFLRRIVSVLRARESTYIVMNAPLSAREQIMDILPSSESPTISPLSDPSWLAIASVVPRGQLDTISETLQIFGVKDIVELGMKRMIPDRNDRVIIEMMEKIYD